MSDSWSSKTAQLKITTSEHAYWDRLKKILNAASSIGRKTPGDCRVA
jgi:hypothetical protein